MLLDCRRLLCMQIYCINSFMLIKLREGKTLWRVCAYPEMRFYFSGVHASQFTPLSKCWLKRNVILRTKEYRCTDKIVASDTAPTRFHYQLTIFILSTHKTCRKLDRKFLKKKSLSAGLIASNFLWTATLFFIIISAYIASI